jgi:hypothetical protein
MKPGEEKRRKSDDILDRLDKAIGLKLDRLHARSDPLRDQKASDSRVAGGLASAHCKKATMEDTKRDSVHGLMRPVFEKIGMDICQLGSDKTHPDTHDHRFLPPSKQGSADRIGSESPSSNPSKGSFPKVDGSFQWARQTSPENPFGSEGKNVVGSEGDIGLASTEAKGWQKAEAHFHWDKETKAMQDTPASSVPDFGTRVAHVLHGLPDGMEPFWRGVSDHLLSDDERKDAQIFRKAWSEYRRLVTRWFDKFVCPHLEVWRLRGIRIRGLLEEVLDASLRPVGGTLLNELCDALAPGACENASASEPGGRPHQFPWSNPSLDRLVLMSSSRGLEAQGDDNSARSVRKVAVDKPAIFASPLPLEKGEVTKRNLISIRCTEDGNMQSVQVPQCLGTEALVNAVKSMLQAFSSSLVEMTIMVPRLVFKVRGADHVRVTVGMRVEGGLKTVAPVKLVFNLLVTRLLQSLANPHQSSLWRPKT